MLTNDTVNLLTLCPAPSLACQVAGTTLTAFQLLVLQLRERHGAESDLAFVVDCIIKTRVKARSAPAWF